MGIHLGAMNSLFSRILSKIQVEVLFGHNVKNTAENDKLQFLA